MAFNTGKYVGNSATYGLSGAATGATIGTALFPGVGTAIGAGVGGLAGLIGAGGQALAEHDWSADKAAKQAANGQLPNTRKGNSFTGYDAYNQQASRLSPQQQALQNSQLGNLQKRLSNNKQFDFAPIEAQARRGFTTQTIPGLAERFTSAGGNSRQGSSAFQEALGNAGAGLESDLAAQKQRYNLEQQKIQQQELSTLLSPSQENFYNKAEGGMGQELLKNLPQYAELAGKGIKEWKDAKAKAEAAGDKKAAAEADRRLMDIKKHAAAESGLNILKQRAADRGNAQASSNIANQRPQANPFNQFQNQAAGMSPQSYPSIATPGSQTYPGSNTPATIANMSSPNYIRTIIKS